MRDFTIDNNPISDVSVVASWPALANVGLQGTLITDVDPLLNLASLTDVRAEFNPNLTSLAGLLNNPSFGAGSTLDVTSTGISCTDVATLEANGVTVLSSCEE